jgi:plastocyanin
LAAVGTLLSWWLPVTAAHAAAPTTYTIGVDAASPQGHNFQYTDYFPRGGAGASAVNIHNGDVVDFQWNQGSLDGFHTATMVPQGQTPNQVWAANPIVGSDSDDGAGQLAFLGSNPGTFGTTPPPGAPGGCGNAATPCAYDGTAVVSSAGQPNAPGFDYVVKIALPGTVSSATTVNFICLVHPGMQGAVTVVPDAQAASLPADVAAAGATQAQADTTEALNGEAAVPAPTTTTNPDGTHTVTATAGAGTAHTEILEMLPRSLHVAPGDTVKWTTLTQRDIHTVTFPVGPASSSVDPFNSPPVCESASGPDPVAPGLNGPPPFGCAGLAAVELPFFAAAAGPTAILPTGYRMAASDGGVFGFGKNTKFFGSTGNITLNKPVVGTADSGDSQGYWNVASDGGIFAFGDAGFFGSTGSIRLNKPVVGMAPTPGGGGYALVASDGGIFTFGDFPFLGSAGGIKLNQPVVGMATDAGNPAGPGYWLAASDGGVFGFGQAPFLGSMGGTRLNKPIVGVASTPDGGGYWLVASDGGVFGFGDARFFGSMGGTALNKPIVGMASSDTGNGYWLVASDGGVFTFGDAVFQGSTGNIKLNKPIVGLAGAPVPSTSGVLANPPAPFPSTFSFSFPQAATFAYECKIHGHMAGAISVS